MSTFFESDFFGNRWQCNKQAAYWFVPNHLKALRQLPREGVLEIAKVVDDLANRYPLAAAKMQYQIPGYRCDEKGAALEMTGAQVIALMVCCIYVLQNENWDLCFGLHGDWEQFPDYAYLAGTDKEQTLVR